MFFFFFVAAVLGGLDMFVFDLSALFLAVGLITLRHIVKAWECSAVFFFSEAKELNLSREASH